MSNDISSVRSVELYHFASCTFCMKVRIYMFFKGIKMPKKDILLNKHAKKELLAGGGKQQVPCLRITRNDGQDEWLYESSAIIQFLRRYRKQ